MGITGVIIAKNEDKIIHNALKSLEFCDEIIVIDNQSTDKTVQIAEKFGAKVVKRRSESFSDLRNFGKDQVGTDYLLYLDADEVVSNTLQEAIVRVTDSDDDYAAYTLNRKNFYLGENEWPFIEKMIRLFKREKLLGWKGDLHESPVVDGKIGSLPGFILHFTHRNLTLMLEKTNEWSKTEARLRYEANHPKMNTPRFIKVMVSTFFNYYFKQKGYKLGAVGLIESIYQTYSTFVTYSKLWEMQKKS